MAVFAEGQLLIDVPVCTDVKLNSGMAISKELLDILVCPLCKAALDLKPDQSGLKCTKRKRVYPIRDEIPVMLIDEAVIEEEDVKAG